MAGLSLRGIRKSFGRTPVIRGVDLDIADEEFVVFVGPSGCGKSTMLRMIAGLEDVGEGEIRIGGRVVNNVPPRDRNIAMVFQNYALYPHMTVARNIAFGLRAAKLPKDEIGRRVRHVAGILGLEALLERRPGELSGGQRQRVAMGRAIVRNPSVFLFDEPLSNLDAQLRNQVRTEIKKMHQDMRVTSIYVTHDQMEAMTLADRIVLLKDGVIEQVGTPEDLFERPANRFVAGFIGSPAMNFLPGTLREDGAGSSLVLPFLSAPCPRLLPAEAAAQAVLGIRPEDFRAGEAAHAMPEACRFEAMVEVVEPLGSESLLLVRRDGMGMQIRLSGRTPPRAGASMLFAVDPAHVHVFDAATGRSLRA
jgi:multiple sugar transport system ATP-binding protein